MRCAIVIISLNLNIYIPTRSHTNSGELPAKVWAFGGGNVVGDISNPLYKACNLAAEQI